MKKWLVISGLLLASIALFIWINNKWITVSEYTITSPDIPKAFIGARIVHISDLQRTTFGEEQSPILKKVAGAEPDLIFVTGDLVDSDSYQLEPVLTLVNGLKEIAEVYFVTGNQEISKGRSEEVLFALKETGITILENEMVDWTLDGETIYIAGIHDPLMSASNHSSMKDSTIHDPLMSYSERMDNYVQKSLNEIPFTGTFTLLLTHRPELIDIYAESEADVVFSGHAHGGQIRIPGIGGLFAPGQGVFPDLTQGVHEFGGAQLVITRGLGNSSFPLRINNRPEVVVVTLKNKEVHVID
ncbi:metallophosphoesterase [Planococcus lenghuensis]|uniref:Calcineurin-like phosphoesterase domain-containing protein n=1 Tax=Planococcus lenghuensis TaxID=2213202 RepID=A0A1Q2KZY5_9BACL|nr:metallophosphoesterase [Planococcus lenghuensis]AQQ53202.1 hypothetical protein B0X71_08985 [Planococcus lenghuensis]